MKTQILPIMIIMALLVAGCNPQPQPAPETPALPTAEIANDAGGAVTVTGKVIC